MGRGCFICAGEALEQYTLSLDAETVLEEQWMCQACYREFRQVEWIEIRETPDLMRGGEANGDEDPDTRE